MNTVDYIDDMRAYIIASTTADLMCRLKVGDDINYWKLHDYVVQHRRDYVDKDYE